MKQAMKRWTGIFLALALLAGLIFPLSVTAAESRPLTFYVMSDIHIYDATEPRHEGDQNDVNISPEAFHAAISEFLAQPDGDILLISGDLTDDSRRIQHEGVVRELQRVTDAGKKVFVVTGNHDYHRGAVDGGGLYDYVPRNRVPEYYNAQFGYQAAYAAYDDFNYAVELAPGYRLLCLNDDDNGSGQRGFSETHLNWILERIAEAKAASDEIFGIMHYALLPATEFYSLFAQGEMIPDYERISTLLADAGMHFIFTGHTHIRNIAQKTTAKGNTITNISTGALCAYPASFRKVQINNGTLHMSTLELESIDKDLGGKTLREYQYDRFHDQLTELFHAMGSDIDAFANQAGTLGLSREIVEDNKALLSIVGKVVNRVTLGQLSLLFLTFPERSVRKIKLADLMADFVFNLYAGDRSYGPDTPIGRPLFIIFKRLDRILGLVRLFGVELPFESLTTLMGGLIYDPLSSSYGEFLL